MRNSLESVIAFRVKEVIANNLQIDIENISEEDNLFSDLCNGMFEVAFLLVDLESSFACVLTNDDRVDQWETVGDVVNGMLQISEVRSYCLANQ